MDLEHEERLSKVEERAKSNTKRLDEVEERQNNLDDLVASVRVLATREERVEKDVTEIKSDVKSIKEKPGKRWEAMVDKIVWAVLAAVIAFLLGRVGL